MKVYTIGDFEIHDSFPHHNYYKIILVWLNHNIKYMPECEVVIYYTYEENNVLFTDHFQKYLKNFDNVTLKKLEPAYGFPIPGATLAMLPYVRNYMMSVWDEPAPFVWMDTDYYLLKPLKDFYENLDHYPFIGCGHGGYQRAQEDHMNGGFYGVGTDEFINCKEAYEYMSSHFPEGSGGVYAGNHWRQQHTINEWMNYKNYDPFAWDDRHYFWNWHGRDCRFSLNDDGSVKIRNEKNMPINGVHFFGTNKPFRFMGAKNTFWLKNLKDIEAMGTEAIDPTEDWGGAIV